MRLVRSVSQATELAHRLAELTTKLGRPHVGVGSQMDAREALCLDRSGSRDPLTQCARWLALPVMYNDCTHTAKFQEVRAPFSTDLSPHASMLESDRIVIPDDN